MTEPLASASASALHYSLLDEPLIRYRRAGDGATQRVTLPALFVAMAADQVRDFPALRPHQRHPWHAFLVQLAAIALHHAGCIEPWETENAWRSALLALTPDHPDGAAWCLVSPPDRPALLQPPVPDGRIGDWKSVCHAADELDMLVTSKNHDLKAGRARRAEVDEWLFALLSLQTQEGFLGRGNYGISRMNGGFASRPGVGIAPVGLWGARWGRDVGVLLAQRDRIAQERGLAESNGHALLWSLPWSGEDSLAFHSLDPLYIEVCRRVRLRMQEGRLLAVNSGSKVARVVAKDLKGTTGDAWTPIEVEEAEALTITRGNFGYKLVSELLTGSKYRAGVAQDLTGWPDSAQVQLIVQATARGKGKTEGYHERRVPVSPKLRRLLLGPQRVTVSEIAKRRVTDIGNVMELLKSALQVLFNNGKFSKPAKSIQGKASTFSKPFEHAEDARFFTDLSEELEAEDRDAERMRWLIGLADRAKAVLRAAFDAGPRSGMQRYKAQAAALSRFDAGLRGPKAVLKDLANHYRQQAQCNQEGTDARI